MQLTSDAAARAAMPALSCVQLLARVRCDGAYPTRERGETTEAGGEAGLSPREAMEA